MAWDNAVVTNAGLGLIAQYMSGQQLWLDYASGGTGTVNPASLMARTALSNQKQIFPIVGVREVENGKKLNIQIINIGLAAGYQMQQVGIWAHINTGPPVLFAILQDAAGIPVPSETDLPEFSMNFYAVIDVSNQGTWNLVVDPSSLVTMQTMQEEIENGIAVVLSVLAGMPITGFVSVYVNLPDPSGLPVGTTYTVMTDETHGDQTSLYEIVLQGGVNVWSYLGGLGQGQGVQEALDDLETLLNGHVTALNAHLAAVLPHVLIAGDGLPHKYGIKVIDNVVNIVWNEEVEE